MSTGSFLIVSLDSVGALIMLTYGIFHCLRIRYRPSKVEKTKRKCMCINLTTISYLIVAASTIGPFISSIFNGLPFLPLSYHSPLFACTYYTMILVELSIITKFAIHLFVVLRSQIPSVIGEKRPIWFKIVCDSLLISFS